MEKIYYYKNQETDDHIKTKKEIKLKNWILLFLEIKK